MDYDTQLSVELGVYRSPGLGISWPELRTKLLAIYGDRVAKLAFVPVDWYSRVEAAMANGDIIRVLPPRMVSGAVKTSELPAWISSDTAAVDAWSQLADIVNKAVIDYATQQAEAGRAELDAAYANATFWDTLYRVDKAIVDAPSAVAGAVAGGVGRLFFANWWVFGLVGIGALLWFNKASIAQAAGRRIARDT